MPVHAEPLKRDLRKSIAGLKKLGTEIRGDLRAASADARKQWKSVFEPQIANVEKLAKEIGAVSHDVVARTVAAFSAFQASIKASPAKPPKKIAPRRPRRRAAASRRTH